MKTIKAKKEITLLDLSKELKKLKNDFNGTNEEIMDSLQTLCMSSRKDIPMIFQNEKCDILFKTFRLKHIPKFGQIINLIPTDGSCCLNQHLMKEYDLTEQEIQKHIIDRTPFSFIVGETTTNLTIMDSHPEDEWDDMNGINFTDMDDNMFYTITLYQNHASKKEVLIEKYYNNEN